MVRCATRAPSSRSTTRTGRLRPVSVPAGKSRSDSPVSTTGRIPQHPTGLSHSSRRSEQVADLLRDITEHGLNRSGRGRLWRSLATHPTAVLSY
jgi:hypothetical protein